MTRSQQSGGESESVLPKLTQFEQRFTSQLRLHLTLVIALFVLSLPVLFAVLMSTQPAYRIVQTTLVGVGADGISNYIKALTVHNFDTYLINSFVMAIAIGIGKVVLALLASMALVYYKLPFKRLILLLILFTLALPVPVRIVPMYELMLAGNRWQLIIDTSFYRLAFDPKFVNTYAGLILPYLASATSILLLRQHFKSISDSLVEQAKLDGVGPLRFLVFVLIPMSKSMIAGLFAIAFIWGWNQYLWPLLIINDQQTKGVIQTGLAQLSPQAGKPLWGIIMLAP
ncbi:carbohydrate ABC transporter permease [Halobacterium sp. CBA1126]|uniref:carbohydrate ABC transporter permease n=1 Tax=Halobacterium sp. CBA1126 TaxID=2668074 RepID=UPI0018D24E9A|nr:carbohydrate ABC transporter permease [Halobacterium sp. CBA1126]